jgi:hypothetical protein
MRGSRKSGQTTGTARQQIEYTSTHRCHRILIDRYLFVRLAFVGQIRLLSKCATRRFLAEVETLNQSPKRQKSALQHNQPTHNT